MSYEVLSDELYIEKDDKKKTKKKNKTSSNNSSFEFENNSSKKKINSNLSKFPILIHILIILIIFGSIFYYFNDNIDLNQENNQTKIITLIGDLNKFNKNISNSNLKLYSERFTLITKTGEFKDEKLNFNIRNFSGNIKLTNNNTILILGKANLISFGKAKLNLKDEFFTLESFKKTKIDLFLNNIKLNFISGRILIGEILNYEFDNSTIQLFNYNCSVNYDGKFSFAGLAQSFSFISPKDKLKIEYNQ